MFSLNILISNISYFFINFFLYKIGCNYFLTLLVSTEIFLGSEESSNFWPVRPLRASFIINKFSQRVGDKLHSGLAVGWCLNKPC